jgi:hypothetical protein
MKANVALMKKLIVDNPGISYKDFVVKWQEAGRSKASVPKTKNFYNARAYIKKHGSGLEESTTGNTKERRAKFVDPTQETKVKKFRQTKDRKNRIIGFLEIELKLEDLIVRAQALKNTALADKIRDARRIAGAEIINS